MGESDFSLQPQGAPSTRTLYITAGMKESIKAPEKAWAKTLSQSQTKEVHGAR